jgi:hypothetical protein
LPHVDRLIASTLTIVNDKPDFPDEYFHSLFRFVAVAKMMHGGLSVGQPVCACEWTERREEGQSMPENDVSWGWEIAFFT